MKKESSSLRKLISALDTDLTEYRPIPFWSWNNEIDENELLKQIEEMNTAGIGGFIVHARTGLKTEYLGEKWFSCIATCLKKARELGLRAWIYDENGWPSGFVGGKLLENPDWRAHFLEYKVTDFFDTEAFCVFKKTDGKFTRICVSEENQGKYHCVYLRISPANTDILNPEVVDAFIAETHEEYYRRFAESFGRELVGFFTDEPQYYRQETPYTPVAAPIFTERYNEDIRDGLIYLFLTEPEGYLFRTRYFNLLNELYVNNFYKKLYDWCEAHNCMLTGHSLDENSARRQMLGGAGVMPTYEYEHIPGIDCLGRDCKTELLAKQVGSVASQLGIKHVLTETFACSGFDVTPLELKSIADFQYFNGVSLMCHHLYPYSFASGAKYDHPPVFSRHGNWFDKFRSFNDYFTRLGFIVSGTDEHCDALIIHPMRDIYLDYTWHSDGAGDKKTDDDFNELLMTLRKNGVTYQLADEKILEKYGKCVNRRLIVGNRSYDTVILPATRTISSSTLGLLRLFGGRLCIIEKPYLVDGIKAEVPLTQTVSLDGIIESTRFSFSCQDGLCGLSAREGELGDFLFIKNYSRTESSHISMKGIAEKYLALDLTDMSIRKISNEMTVEKCGGLVLMRDEIAEDVRYLEKTEDITEQFALTAITENYLVLDNGYLSYDGKAFGELLPLQRISEDLLRLDYKGRVFIKYRFFCADVLPIKLILEREKYISVSVNGKDFSLCDSDFDINFVEAEIGEYLCEGENEIIYSLDYHQHDGVRFALFDPLATESLRNCLYYDTNLESVYLKGDFTLDEKLVIHKRTALPFIRSDNFKRGYPFFKGELTVRGKYSFNGEGDRILSLDDGRFLVADIFINGKKTDMVTSTQRNITDMLRLGENDIEIALRSSLRNLFGPHHCANNPEPMSVHPSLFTFRGKWRDGIAQGYTPKYQCVPFGLDSIRMITRILENG
ncbi:MAG: hypothetical protein J6A83_02420 [Clostridia bacterium]|nr:hypothetical protein [Clostridia bacterium]